MIIGIFSNCSNITANAAVYTDYLSNKPDWYDIDLSEPAWVGEDAAGLGVGFEME
jgi:hypothetical protein